MIKFLPEDCIGEFEVMIFFHDEYIIPTIQFTVIYTFQAADAMSYVAGYTVAHDVSARHWQIKKNGGQWLLGKTFDTFCPLGPAIVTTASISGENQPHIYYRV